jgi:hypothetical protein
MPRISPFPHREAEAVEQLVELDRHAGHGPKLDRDRESRIGLRDLIAVRP